MADSYGENVNAALLLFMGSLQGTVLDVGCGRGAWAPHLRALGADRLVGVEPSADSEFARDRYDDFLSGPIQEVALPKVDTVIVADVLEHLVDPWAVLTRLRQATVGNRRLYVSVPNAQFIKAVATVARGDFPYKEGGFWDRTHLRWFTARSLARMLAETGWRSERVGYCLGGGLRSQVHNIIPRADALLGHQLHMSATAAL